MKAEGVRACAERTLNMDLMSVTLDVLKLSGWLNADAPYRVGRRAYDAGQGIWSRGGRAWAGGSASAACTGNGPAVKVDGAGACAERTLNMNLMSVTLDVSKLSGWLNADAPYRVEMGAYDAGRGGVRAWAGGSEHQRHAATERRPGCEGGGG